MIVFGNRVFKEVKILSGVLTRNWTDMQKTDHVRHREKTANKPERPSGLGENTVLPCQPPV